MKKNICRKFFEPKVESVRLKFSFVLNTLQNRNPKNNSHKVLGLKYTIKNKFNILMKYKVIKLSMLINIKSLNKI